MKKIIYLSLVLLFAVMLAQCTKEPQNIMEGAKEGGYVTVDNANINYVVGDGKAYSFTSFVHQNSEFDVVKLHIMKSARIYQQADSSVHSSNEIEAEVIDVEGTDRINVASKGYSYADLIEGLTIDGNPLPTSDVSLNIGDKFVFRIVAEMADGSLHQQSYTVNMTVSTRYAGTYIITEGAYYRLGDLSADMWVGGEAIIESVDATTYRYYEWGILSGWDGNVLYFQVDSETGKITYPAKWNGEDQKLNGQPLTTCETTPGELSNVNCNDYNVVVNDDVEGKDQLKMTYGYLTAGSGPREFQFVLTKK